MNTPAETPSGSPPKRRRRIGTILFFAALAVLLVIAGWVFAERQRGKSALEKYKRDLLAKGEKLTFPELLVPVPEGDNKGPELIGLGAALREGNVLTLKRPPAMKLIAPGKAMVVVKEEEWFLKDEKKSFRWEEAEADLKINAGTLRNLREIARSPVLRAHVQYRGLNTAFRHLAVSKRCAQWLSASAIYNVHAKDATSAIEDVETTVLLAQFLEHEPFLISQLVRIAIVNIALTDCWVVLQADKAGDAELHRLQQVLEKLDLAGPMIRALQGERVMCQDTIRTLRSSEDGFDEVLSALRAFGDGVDGSAVLENVPYNEEIRDAIRSTVIVPIWRFVWSFEDERRMAQEVQQLLEASRTAKRERSALAMVPVEELLKENSGPQGDFKSFRYWTTGLFVPGISQSTLRALQAETQRDMTIAAIALKRYHLRHGKYPASLDELSPEFLREHPVDWMDGQKLRYRAAGDSFVLWSVGNDRKDDSGKPDESEPYNFYHGPDLVWPQPASAEEVAEYKHRLKPSR